MPNYSNNLRGYGNRPNYYRYPVQENCDCQNVIREVKEDTCGCSDKSNHMVLAMATVPWQKWQYIYDAEKALHRGTIFEELDKPFEGRGMCKR